MKRKMFLILALASCIVMGVNAQKVRRKVITQSKKTIPAKVAIPKPIDMGLSVKWSDINLGGNTMSSGPLLDIDKGREQAGALGEGWRLPTTDEWQELIDNCKIDIILNNGLASKMIFTSHKNGAAISVIMPKIALKNLDTGENMINNGKPSPQGLIGSFAIFGCDDDKIIKFLSYKNPQSVISNVQNLLESNGISLDIKTWSDDCRRQLDQQFRNDHQIIGESRFMEWLTIKALADITEKIEINIRPVFEDPGDE